MDYDDRNYGEDDVDYGGVDDDNDEDVEYNKFLSMMIVMIIIMIVEN